jgi:hypothetical protein
MFIDPEEGWRAPSQVLRGRIRGRRSDAGTIGSNDYLPRTEPRDGFLLRPNYVQSAYSQPIDSSLSSKPSRTTSIRAVHWRAPPTRSGFREEPERLSSSASVNSEPRSFRQTSRDVESIFDGHRLLMRKPNTREISWSSSGRPRSPHSSASADARSIVSEPTSFHWTSRHDTSLLEAYRLPLRTSCEREIPRGKLEGPRSPRSDRLYL